MKYHTTLSTIVISLFVLLCFSLTVLFCVFVLSVQSPGYLIADQIISHIDNSSDFSVSFSSIDRNISSRTVINGISLDYKDENILYADKITIYQGPLSLVWFFLTGTGRVETDVTGLRVTLDPLLEEGSKDSSSSMSIEDVNRLIQSVESYDAVLSQMAFYNLSYSINIEDFSLRMGSGLSFENLRMNLSLNEGLELDSFVFSAPSAGISLADAAVSADNISLSLSKDVSGYRTRFSIDRLSGWYQDISLDAENTALTLDFESFASLDLMHLPLGLSASSISLEAADWQAGAQRLSASTDAEGGDIVLIGLSLASPDLSASAQRTEINLLQTDEGYTVSFALPSGPELRLADPSVDVAAGSVSGSVSLTGVMSWDVSLADTFVSGLDGLTKGLYSSARISSLTLSGQANDTARFQKLMKEQSELQPIAAAYKEYKDCKQTVEDSLSMLEEESDEEMREMLKEELSEAKKRIEELEHELKILLLPKDPNDEKNVIVEIRAGAGGDEAALFAAEIYRMYVKYAESQRWKTELLTLNENGIGGFKEVTFMIYGQGAYSKLKYESGVHRVQRVPETESGGRIHTSTITVAIMPEAEEIDFHLDLNDCKFDVFRASGNGGQCVNTTDSAVRLTHIPTGIVISCQDEKSQLKNKDKALKILRSRLYDMELQKRHDEEAEARRSQVGTGDRSEKIRTYNFPQGRVTDHRIKLTLHKLDSVLNGDLQEIIDNLIAADQTAKLANMNE